ncbi:hypothetical protein [Companilactobacillus mishanensis]|uniref:hypothetical protein n=1 Tax=Companilactobacillus mishanensis TaxID=2486008 RepID=UPI001EE9452A|nr:hypothetical protein [Companilactobacillus mishanensis]
MSTIKFDDYLKLQLKDPAFKAGFEVESARLERELKLSKLLNHENYNHSIRTNDN